MNNQNMNNMNNMNNVQKLPAYNPVQNQYNVNSFYIYLKNH